VTGATSADYADCSGKQALGNYEENEDAIDQPFDITLSDINFLLDQIKSPKVEKVQL
jgi:hypothetical protein